MFRRVLSQAIRVAKPTLFTTSQMNISVMAKSLMTSTQIAMPRLSLSAPVVFSLPARSFHIKKKTNRRKTTKPYKLKTHRASAKRFWVSGSGKIMRNVHGKRHRMRNKSSRQLRRLSQKVQVPKALRKRYQKSMPYLF